MCAPDTTKPPKRNNSALFVDGGIVATNDEIVDVNEDTTLPPLIPQTRQRRRGPVTTNNENSNNSRRTINHSGRRSPSSVRRRHSVSEASSHITAGTLLGLFFVAFAAYFPFFLAPSAAEATYQQAAFEYNADLTHFDNSVWTWATDYLLALGMAVIIWSFPSTRHSTTSTTIQGGTHAHKVTTTTTTRTSISHVVTLRSQAMLFCYLLSVLSGGMAHQFYTTIESRRHWSFRFLWTVCVGTVTAASAFMGSIGTELNHIDIETRGAAPKLQYGTLPVSLPVVPAWFWAGFAACSTLIVIVGGMSYQRPACDIFVAGITQSPSTFYVMAIMAVGLLQHPISKATRIMGAIGFILNAPLLPMYPLLVQYTDWSLGAVNTLLHTWLFVAWSMQGISLRTVAIALEEFDASSWESESTDQRLHES